MCEGLQRILEKSGSPRITIMSTSFKSFLIRFFQWALWTFTKSGRFLTFNSSTYFKSMSHFIGNIFRKYNISNSWSYCSVYKIVSQLSQLAFVCLKSTMETSKQLWRTCSTMTKKTQQIRCSKHFYLHHWHSTSEKYIFSNHKNKNRAKLLKFYYLWKFSDARYAKICIHENKHMRKLI